MILCECTTEKYNHTIFIPLQILTMKVLKGSKNEKGLILSEVLNLKVVQAFEKTIQYEASTLNSKVYMGEYLCSLNSKQRTKEWCDKVVCPIALSETELNSVNEQKSINRVLNNEVESLIKKFGINNNNGINSIVLSLMQKHL